jgi:hypothetical protein
MFNLNKIIKLLTMLIIAITILFYCFVITQQQKLQKKHYNIIYDNNNNDNDCMDTNLNTTQFNIDQDNETIMHECDLIPKRLIGPTKVLITNYTEKEIEDILSKDGIEFGGRYKPKNCKTNNEIAILIPYRDRYKHLLDFLLNMHPIFIRQELSYSIYLIEPINNITFNRGLLFNIGFIESNKLNNNWKCYALHDIDLLSENDRLLYHCPQSHPTHLSYLMNKHKYRPNYENYFGGVSVVNKEHYLKANGFSNVYFGWGSEDDDFRDRLVLGNNYTIIKPKDIAYARYYMHKHKPAKKNPFRSKLRKDGLRRFKIEGLNSLKYELLEIQQKPLFTKYSVYYNENEILKEANISFTNNRNYTKNNNKTNSD